MKIRVVILTLATALIAACVSQPQPLQGQFATITPRQAADHDSTGAGVRWGGRIVEVEPGQNRTCFEMLATRLDVCRSGFYDPALFQKNREVTFTGHVDGYENRRIGGYDYRFPHIAADVVYLWPVRERVNVITRPAPWPWWGWW